MHEYYCKLADVLQDEVSIVSKKVVDARAMVKGRLGTMDLVGPPLPLGVKRSTTNTPRKKVTRESVLLSSAQVGRRCSQRSAHHASAAEDEISGGSVNFAYQSSQPGGREPAIVTIARGM